MRKIVSFIAFIAGFVGGLMLVRHLIFSKFQIIAWHGFWRAVENLNLKLAWKIFNSGNAGIMAVLIASLSAVAAVVIARRFVR